MRELLSFNFLEPRWSAFSTLQLSPVMSPCRTQYCSSLCAHRLHLLDDRLITAVRCTPADRFRIIADARRREYTYRVSGMRFGVTDSLDNWINSRVSFGAIMAHKVIGIKLKRKKLIGEYNSAISYART